MRRAGFALLLTALGAIGCQDGVALRADATSPRGAGAWTAEFEDGSLAEWSIFYQEEGGSFGAESPPAGQQAHRGDGVGRFEVTPEQQRRGLDHSKVFKIWVLGWPETRRRDHAGRRFARLPRRTPAGRYAAWFYLPRDYRPAREWVNIFQFKESYLERAGDANSWRQVPQWWVNLKGDRRGRPQLIVNNWSGRPVLSSQRRAPLGRWFQITANLRPGRHIAWRLDGRRWYRARDSVYPVGIRHRRPTGWVFGVGHYGGVGRLWVDSASFTPR